MTTIPLSPAASTTPPAAPNSSPTASAAASSPSQDSTLCPKHAGTEAGELAATLTSGLDEFTSAAPINQFLSRLLLLLAQDRIAPRRGAVMAYTANLLLRSVTVMEQETAATRIQKSTPSISSGSSSPSP